MTDITLYDGCFVKTAAGTVHGPFSKYRPERFECLAMFYDNDGQPTQHALPEWFVIAVYSSLAAAAAANPEM